MDQTLEIKILSSEEPLEMKDLQGVLENTPRYFELVNGVPPGPAEAQSVFTEVPEGKSEDDKFTFGIYLGSEMIGCADLVKGYPNSQTVMLGLLLISEKFQKMKWGSKAFGELEDYISTWPNITKIRIGVVRTNSDTLHFWKKLGFKTTGEVKPYRHGTLTSEKILLEKAF